MISFFGLYSFFCQLIQLTFSSLLLQKYDLGPCQYTHSQPARNSYLEVCDATDYGYEALLARKLRSIVRECDRRIEMNQRRVDENEREKTRMKPEDEAIASLSAKYDALMENGDLDEASKIETQIEEIKSKKAAAAAAAESAQGPSTESSAAVGQMLATLGNHPQYQALRVCDQCGLLLSAKEDTKLDDHFEGKLHSGYVQIREKLGEVEHILESDREGERSEPQNGHHRDAEMDQPYKPVTTQTEAPAITTDENKPITSTDDSTTPQAATEAAEPKESAPTENASETAPTEESKPESTPTDLPKKEEPEKPKRAKRARATEGYETELPEPPSRQRDRDRPRYGDARDKEYERDRDRDRYSQKDRYRGRRGGGNGGRDYDDRRSSRDRDNSYRDGDRRDGNSHRDRDSDRYRDSYRERY